MLQQAKRIVDLTCMSGEFSTLQSRAIIFRPTVTCMVSILLHLTVGASSGFSDEIKIQPAIEARVLTCESTHNKTLRSHIRTKSPTLTKEEQKDIDGCLADLAMLAKLYPDYVPRLIPLVESLADLKKKLVNLAESAKKKRPKKSKGKRSKKRS